MQMRSLIVALFALCLFGSPAFAHIGHGHTETLSTGFFHLLGGIDHVLAMLAVGLYATSLGGSAIWLIPVTFVVTMVVGGGAAMPDFLCPMSSKASGFLSSSWGLRSPSG